jgi:hypothetical protein
LVSFASLSIMVTTIETITSPINFGIVLMFFRLGK